MIVEISAAKLLPHLRKRLEAGGCSVDPISPHACRVVHQQAVDADEALGELRFFVGAWARSHDEVVVSVRPEI